MSFHLLDRINYGYGPLEPVVVGLMAVGKNLLFIGRHGLGKTRIARTLSQGFGAEGFVFYDATKDDLVTIAGLPDVDGFKTGRLQFIGHQRAIWNKTTIVVDEITRAGKESQNLWLEILEDRTCFGIPLPYRSLVATANPESYAAAFHLDEALLDRFHAVLPIPEWQEGLLPQQVEEMVALTLGDQPLPSAEEIAGLFAEIQSAHGRKPNPERLGRYLGQVVPPILELLKGKERGYMSPRLWARNLPESIQAVRAYYHVLGDGEALERAAEECLTYCVATRFGLSPAALKTLHDQAKSLLTDKVRSPAAQIRFDLQMRPGFEERLAYLRDQGLKAAEHLPPDEMERLLGDLLRGATVKGHREKLLLLKDLLTRLGYEGDLLRQLDGHLALTLNAAINQAFPLLQPLEAGDLDEGERETFTALWGALREGSFLSSTHPAVQRFKAWLLEQHEAGVKFTAELVRACLKTLS